MFNWIKKNKEPVFVTRSKEKSIGVVIGRFQIFHNGHMELVENSLKNNDLTIILVGSKNRTHNIKNPFPFSYISSMIHGSIIQSSNINHFGKFIITSLDDCIYEENADVKWIKRIIKSIDNIKGSIKKVNLYGYLKDDSSYYLNFDWPSDWKIKNVENNTNIDATFLRELMFTGRHNLIKPFVSTETYDIVCKFIGNSVDFSNLQQEFLFIQKQRQKASCLEFPPHYITVDALVKWKDKILLIKRGGIIGKDKYAMPGGFHDGKTSLLGSCYREVEEETGLDLTNIKPIKSMVFDGQNRMHVGISVTHVFMFDLSNHFTETPVLVAGDDAIDTNWFDFGRLYTGNIFNDHYFIIKRMLYDNDETVGIVNEKLH